MASDEKVEVEKSIIADTSYTFWPHLLTGGPHPTKTPSAADAPYTFWPPSPTAPYTIDTPSAADAGYTIGTLLVTDLPYAYACYDPNSPQPSAASSGPAATTFAPAPRAPGHGNAMLAFFDATLESPFMRNILSQNQVTKDVK